MKRFVNKLAFELYILPLTVLVIPVLFALTLQIVFSFTFNDAPRVEQNIQFGDLRPWRTIVGKRADHPARVLIKFAFNDKFKNPHTIREPYILENGDCMLSKA